MTDKLGHAKSASLCSNISLKNALSHSEISSLGRRVIMHPFIATPALSTAAFCPKVVAVFFLGCLFVCLFSLCCLSGCLCCLFPSSHSVGAVNVAVSCPTGTMKERDSSFVRNTTGPATGSTATAARTASQKALSW